MATRPTVADDPADHNIFMNGRLTRQTVTNASWFEGIAKSDKVYNSTSANQIDGHITNLAASDPIAVKNRVDDVTKEILRVDGDITKGFEP